MKLSLNLRKKKSDSSDVSEPAEAKVAKRPTTRQASGGAKAWLFLHVEKLALCSVLLFVGLMVYSAVGKLTLDKKKTPDALEKQMAQVSSRIRNSPFPDDRFPVPKLTQEVDRSREPVPEGRFAFGSMGRGTMGPQLRSDPEFLAAEQVEARAGSGIFFVKEGGVAVNADGDRRKLPKDFPAQGVARPADARNQVKRWVAINALLPIARQKKLYEVAFNNAVGFNATRDAPEYIAATFQRVEIPAGGSTGAIDWDNATEISFRRRMGGLRKEAGSWATTAPEVVESVFVQRPSQGSVGVITEPLGPLAFKSWKPWALHSKTPAAVVRPRRRPGRGVARRPAVRPRAAPVVAAPPVVDPLAADDGPGIFDAPEKTDEPEMPGEAADAATDPVEPEPEPPAASQFKLVRIFDFSVKPGKSYRYRLKLAIFNPNRTFVSKRDKTVFVPVKHLVNKDAGKDLVRETGWSDPSPVVYVPQDAQVFAGPMAPPSEESPYEAVEVLVKILKQGQELAAKLVLRRGAVAQGLSDILGVSPDRTSVVSQKGVTIETEYTLLDMVGGSTLSTDVASPMELLFMDASGNLIAQASDDDEPELVAFELLEKAAATPARGQRPRPGVKDDEDDEDDVNLFDT